MRKGTTKALQARVKSVEDALEAQGRVNRRLRAERERARLRADALGWALVLAQQHVKCLEASLLGGAHVLAE